jgi:hypothetical protein
MGLNAESPITARGPESGLDIPTTILSFTGAGAGAGAGAGVASLVQPGITVKITTKQIMIGIAYLLIFFHMDVPPVYLRSTLQFSFPESYIPITSLDSYLFIRFCGICNLTWQYTNFNIKFSMNL